MNDRRRHIRSLAQCCVLLVAIPGVLEGQTPGTGAIVGRVFDPSGALVAHARVSAMNDGSNLSRQVTTTNRGDYEVALLPPGEYTIKVEQSGFEPEVLHSISVVVSETRVVDVKLRLGRAATELEVTAGSELAQTESSALGRVTDEKAIVSLPLANRNFTQILALSPGAIVDVPNAGALGANTQNITVNGAKTTANNFQFNGIDANNISQNSLSGFEAEPGIAIPAPDTIAEFKVQTGMYDAGYGRGAGANIDLVSKAGTNRLHGDVWEFFRNNVLNANDFFLKQNGQPRPVLSQNQFGGTLGGPLRKNKTFFFVSYQGTVQRNGQASGALQSTFLPPLTNDRSPAALGALFGGQSGAFGGVAVANDGSNISPVALALLNFKLPNGSYAIPSPQTILPSGIGESTFSIPAHFREDQFSVNIDHNFSERNQLSGRFFSSQGTTSLPFTPFAATVPGFGTDMNQRNTMFVLSDTHVFKPNLVNIARFGYIWFNGLQTNISPITAADVGMATPAGLPTIPGIDVAGLFNIGPSGEPTYFQNTNTFVWQDTLSLTHGSHSMRMGAEAKRYEVNVDVPYVIAGFLFFQSFPDFLLGGSAAQNGSGQSNIFQSVGASGLFRKDTRYTDAAGFFQDDVRATSQLTLNLGLRYEFFGPPTEINGHLSNFDPQIATPQVPATGSFSGFLLPANFQGQVPSGVTKTSYSGWWNSDYTNFSPRFGFALRVHDNPAVVVRGGYGIYYTRLSGQLVEQNVGQPPFALTQSLQGAGNAAATFAEPYTPPLPPNSAYPIFIPRTPDSAISVAAVGQNLKSPYAQQYDLNVQYEFARNLLWEVGYVGSITSRLTGCYEFNQALLATPQNPVNGETTTTNENVAQRVPWIGVAGGSYICDTSFSSNYNALQTTVIKRLSHGLDFQGSYTYSKNLDYTSGTGVLSSLDLSFLGNDQTNRRESYGVTDFNRKHRFILSATYAPPIAIGSGLLRRALSRWQLSGLLVLQSGLPITIINSQAASVYGNLPGFSRGECTGASQNASGPLLSRLNNYFNPAAFAPLPVIGDGTGFGSCSVGTTWGFDQKNLDLGIEKTIPVKEIGNLQFRTEFFNLTNTPKFALPVNDQAAPSLGVISSTASGPRIVQFALKFLF
jgi:Carboxypeptidase regulatory-like domain/TonB-dependent Receptor Plug Domain/TonB dependent receptor